MNVVMSQNVRDSESKMILIVRNKLIRHQMLF
jgi:hypothetical protein